MALTRRWPYKRQSKRCASRRKWFASRTCPGATVIHLAGGNRSRHEGISAFLQKRTPDFKGRYDGIHPQPCRKGRDDTNAQPPERLNSFNDEMHAQLAECLNRSSATTLSVACYLQVPGADLCWSGS